MSRPQTSSHCIFDDDDYQFTPKMVKQEPDEEIPEAATEVEIVEDSDASYDDGEYSEAAVPHNFKETLLEHILPYAKYLSEPATKTQYYDKIQMEMQPKCPRIRGRRLRKLIRSYWSRMRLAAEKKVNEKRLLTEVSKIFICLWDYNGSIYP
uniref:BESS domain-containing protein n=1 Tax=Bursaphelenchus xylophilus TaxID=6326 RepID=A0A1I7SFN3_BURXY